MRRKRYINLLIFITLLVVFNIITYVNKKTYAMFDYNFFNGKEDQLINEYLVNNNIFDNFTYYISYYEKYKSIVFKQDNNYKSLYFHEDKEIKTSDLFEKDMYKILNKSFEDIYGLESFNNDNYHFLFNNEGIEVIYYDKEEYKYTYLFDELKDYLNIKPFSIHRNKKYIAFTFDDGPSVHTDRLLNILSDNYANATFFLLGNNINRYKDTVIKMNALGFEIGNHSTNHKDLSKLTCKEMRNNINHTDELIKSITKNDNNILLRPPYGAINSKVVDCLSKPLILWNIDTEDWYTRDKASVKKEILKNPKDGDIILFHDLYESTIDAVEEAIPELYKRGFQIVSVSELAQSKEIKLKNKARYRYIR